MDSLPPSFWRVQHQESYTNYDAKDGFSSRGHYYMPLSHWINKGKIEGHLDKNELPPEPTPFISVFDNEDEAIESVRFHQRRGEWNVTLSRIDTSSLHRTLLNIQFRDTTVHLPAWSNSEGVTFISNPAVRQRLNVDFRIGQFSEWLALDCIPAWMIQYTALL